jgi:tRNA/rRNA methyltransferase
MAGTDRTKGAAAAKLASSGAPAIILVEPQLGENIGAVARAMLNCALVDLRLVRPRDGWPNPKAAAAASGADIVLERARLFDSVEAAIADLARLYATSARPREMVKPVLTPRRVAVEIRAAAARGERVGLLFGPERAGLSNDHLALADAMVLAPLNPAFASLNLAQAVLLLGYEWYQAGKKSPARTLPLGRSPIAAKAELVGLFGHLEGALDRSGFLRNAEKRPTMVRNIRNMLDRAGLTRQEVRTLRGIVASLVEPKPARIGRKAAAAAPGQAAKPLKRASKPAVRRGKV